MSRYWRRDLRLEADAKYAAAAALQRARADMLDLGDSACLEARRRELCDQARRLEMLADVGRRFERG